MDREQVEERPPDCVNNTAIGENDVLDEASPGDDVVEEARERDDTAEGAEGYPDLDQEFTGMNGLGSSSDVRYEAYAGASVQIKIALPSSPLPYVSPLLSDNPSYRIQQRRGLRALPGPLPCLRRPAHAPASREYFPAVCPTSAPTHRNPMGPSRGRTTT